MAIGLGYSMAIVSAMTQVELLWLRYDILVTAVLPINVGHSADFVEQKNSGVDNV